MCVEAKPLHEGVFSVITWQATIWSTGRLRPLLAQSEWSCSLSVGKAGVVGLSRWHHLDG